MATCARCGRELKGEEERCPACFAPVRRIGADAGSRPRLFSGSMEEEDTLILRLLEENRPASGEIRPGCLWLIDPRDGQIERRCELTSPVITIGRTNDCDIFLASNTVSRRHAEICREGDSHFLRDLNSTNGTLLNGEPVIGEEQLRDWDEIGVGIFKLIFRQE